MSFAGHSCKYRKQKAIVIGLGKGLVAALLTAWLFFDFEPVCLILAVCIPFYIRDYKRKSMQKELWENTLAFKDALLYIKNGLAAGYSPEHSMKEAKKGLEQLLGDNHAMTVAFQSMLTQISLGNTMEQALEEYAKRSKIEEAEQFAELFSIVKRTGGSLFSVIRQTVEVLQEKTELKRELRMAVAAKNAEFRVMSMIPHAMLFYLKVCSPSMLQVLYHNSFGIVCMTSLLCLYLFLRWLGSYILKTTFQ